MNTIRLLILFLGFSVVLRSQNLNPTEDKALLNIKVTNFSSKALSGETVMFISKKDGKEYIVKSSATGNAQLLLPEGSKYDIKYRDFMEQQEYSSIEIPSQPGAFTYDLTIKFEPAKTYTLKNVHYETGKATLTQDSYPALNNLYEALKEKPTLEIEIAGHTDNIGTYEKNLTLSQERANSVKKYLVAKGINANRITAKGYADTQPVASNDDETGRAKNRRTEVRIIKE
ncbi:MAG: OmpA family protein [Bacteroidales bacterium]|nr:OmpA family protein [Bacteroidales bacterium]